MTVISIGKINWTSWDNIKSKRGNKSEENKRELKQNNLDCQ